MLISVVTSDEMSDIGVVENDMQTKGNEMTLLLTIEQAITLRNDLTEQAQRNGLKGADGEPLLFKTVRVVEDKRVKVAFEVKVVEMVHKYNLLNRTGKGFWIDRDTPPYLDPSTETYHSM